MAQRRFKIFAGSSIGDLNAYFYVEKLANEWLKANPGAKVVEWKTDQKADDEFTEFALTVLVEMPESDDEDQGEETSQGRSYELNYDADKKNIVVDSVEQLIEAIASNVNPGGDFSVFLIENYEAVGYGEYHCESHEQPYLRCNESEKTKGFIEVLNEARERLDIAKEAYTYQLYQTEDTQGWYDPTPMLETLLEEIEKIVANGEKFKVLIFDGEQREVGRANYMRVPQNDEITVPGIEVLSEDREAIGLLDRLNAIRDSKMGQEG